MTPEFYKIAEKVSLVPIVWVTCFYVCGILFGLWSLLLLPLLFFKKIRPLTPYFAAMLCGCVMILSDIETERLPSVGLRKFEAVVADVEGDGCYVVDVFGVSDSVGGNIRSVGVRAAALFDKALQTDFERGDTLVFTAGVTDLPAYDPSPKSRLYRLMKSGVRDLLVVYNDNHPIFRAPVREGVWAWARDIRGFVTSRIDSLSISDDDKGVLKAMTVGERDAVGSFAEGRYRRGGISHIMALSGLHVGVLFLIVSMLLAPLKRYYLGRKIRSVIVILILWGYAVVSGLSPSVLRAVVMFSLFALRGNTVPLSSNGYNVLFASALLLTLMEPSMVFDIGFVLSYMSVFAILFFVPKAEAFLSADSIFVRKRVARFFFLAFAVTLIVQLFTMPLTLYSFGQVSIVAPLNNLVTALAVTPLLLFSVIYLFLPFPVVDHTIGYLFTVINDTLEATSHIPFAYIRDIDFPFWGMVASFVAIFMIMCRIEVSSVHRERAVSED